MYEASLPVRTFCQAHAMAVTAKALSIYPFPRSVTQLAASVDAQPKRAPATFATQPEVTLLRNTMGVLPTRSVTAAATPVTFAGASPAC